MAVLDHTWTDLATRACYQARRDPTDTYDLERAKEHVRDCELAILNEAEQWRFLQREVQITITSSTDKYTLASIGAAASPAVTVDRVLALFNDTTGNEIKLTGWRDLEAAAMSSQETDEERGEPEYAAIVNNDSLRFWPPCPTGQTYNIGCLVQITPDELSGSNANSALPDPWTVRLLVTYATAKLMQESGGQAASNEAQLLLGEFDKYVEMFRQRYAYALPEEIVFMSGDTTTDLDLESVWSGIVP